jgi:hypothetical protein
LDVLRAEARRVFATSTGHANTREAAPARASYPSERAARALCAT